MTKKLFKDRDDFWRLICGIIAILGFLLIWHFGTNGTRLGEIMPGPIVILKSFFEAFTQKTAGYTIFGHTFWSLSRVLVGYSVACILGISLGLLMGRYRLAEAIFRPFYEMIRPIPPIAWISLAILWFGLGETMAYFIIFLSAFNNITINVFMGTKSINQELVGCAKMLGANEAQVFRTVVIPATIPYIFAGMQIGISSSWAAVVAAEMVRSSKGLGFLIVSGMDINNISQIFVGILAIGIVGFLLATIMRGVEGKLCQWNVRGK
ncbi:ABC transporter permease [Diplocloster agilis]|uniref:ABC transporter permease n=1 Tax=Diplocloster agilis TaxID=2850323 RepID=UPI00082301EE|nr:MULTISPECIES: ABC transporter permease [Lachnospiraceae]MBU9743942.1 ABC transporter permease [Diplocloster agilis]MCU6733682.1 ABC transporter permease [Suonthocola fibrivorans]SCJ03755.1 Bicarbonate transport system permease protein CmpB [uncultured Clostridium sp.]